MARTAGACWLLILAVPALGAGPGPEFDAEIAPLLSRACLECHAGAEPEGGLDLSREAGLQRGGVSGPAFNPGKWEQSRLWQRVRDGEMPPRHPLSPTELELMRRWIEAGAVWGADPIDPFQNSTDRRAGYDWWALRPLSHPPPPVLSSPDSRETPSHPIDRFIEARLRAEGLAPAPMAERRVLIRRLSFDLLGLPPSPEEAAAFLSDDRPEAYERLVDRLLASPDYGLRWGRHWLDVARFGESQGFERDKLRENAWPYRDWVIRALNDDLPYDEFARLQIAGDVLPGRDRDGVIATGFLVAGPWDEVGQLQQSAAMRAVVRQDELEDYVSLVGQTFLGLTVHCARCHDHKFDPIRQEEYFRLAAALDGVRHGSRELLTDDETRRQQQLTEAIAQCDRDLATLADRGRARAATAGEREAGPSVPLPLARWNFDADFQDELGGLHAFPTGTATIVEGGLRLDGKSGYAATVPLRTALREKTLEAWVRLGSLDQRGGGVIGVQTLDGSRFDSIVFGEQEPRRWMAGSDHFRRTQSLSGPVEVDAADRAVHVALVYHADGSLAAYRDGRPYGASYQSSGLVEFPAGEAQVIFGLRHGPPGGNKRLTGWIDAAQLYDRALTPAEVAASANAGPAGAQSGEWLAALGDDDRERWTRLRERRELLRGELRTIRPLSVYVVAPRAPGETRLLRRGNPATPDEVVVPGGLRAVPGVEPDFQLPANASDADRRQALAAWVTSPQNPLFARVIVNRVWQHHFGAGLVTTTSDFGFNGGRPSHPDLLDWLATEFVRNGQSLKALHRLIVTSATYRQSSRLDAHAAAVDAQNRLLWRMSPRRLDAESLRDAMLRIAGQLNVTLGGPGYRDFETFVRNSQFYDVRDFEGPEFSRRTVYRTAVRSGRLPLLDAFDCPDPSTKTPERAVTVTPLQALALWNNTFVLRMSRALAARVEGDVGADLSAQVDRASTLVCGRSLDHAERHAAVEFVRTCGLPEYCRVLFNSSEFLYVD